MRARELREPTQADSSAPRQAVPPDLGGDPGALAAYTDRLLADLSGAMAGVLCGIGDRLGLFTALAAGPCGSVELAERTGLDERYLREWLHCLASAGYLSADPATGRFELPGPLALLLATESPMNLAGAHALLLALAGAVDAVTDAMRTGAGIAPDAYPDDLYRAMERMSASWLDTMLVEQWIPAVPGLAGRLTRGGRAADVGCGGGRALIRLAQGFPSSEFVGVDMRPSAVRRAADAARTAGVADRVRLVTGDAAQGLPGPFDLVTVLDMLHDVTDPEALLRAVRAALAPDGTVLLLESRSAATPWQNTGPPATILYATSLLYCLPSSRTGREQGSGTLGMPADRIRELAGAAGFGRIREVPVYSPFNALYELRP